MIRDVLLLQQQEIYRRLQEPYVERAFDPAKLAHDLVKVVIGPRRAGKSFFAMHLVQRLGRFGYVNFDDERLTTVEDYDELIAAVNSLYGSPEHLLLDEVQNLPKWELFVNRLQRQGYRLTITGSNAHLLSSELATHLTGRHVQIVLLPFSFSEFVRTKGRDLTQTESAEALGQYAEAGGYPEPLLKPLDRREYLTTLLRATIYKDIVVRHRIRAPQGMDDLAAYLMANIAQECSLNTLAEVTRLRSVHTVGQYLHHLEEAFLFFRVRTFSFKVRQQARANRKVYCIDNGLVACASFRFSAGLGRLYENAVAIALRKQEMEGKHELYFWKNPQHEVDFVVKEGPRVARLIQVCADVSDPKTRAREVRALLTASEALRCDELLVLTEDTEEEEDASWFGQRGRVRFLPLWKWLLAQG